MDETGASVRATRTVGSELGKAQGNVGPSLLPTSRQVGITIGIRTTRLGLIFPGPAVWNACRAVASLSPGAIFSSFRW